MRTEEEQQWSKQIAPLACVHAAQIAQKDLQFRATRRWKQTYSKIDLKQAQLQIAQSKTTCSRNATPIM